MNDNKIVRLNGDRLVNCPIEQYDKQLNDKVNKYKGLINEMYNGDIDIYESERSHYRMRANFNIWRDMPPKTNKGKKYTNGSNKNINDTSSDAINNDIVLDPKVYYAMFDEFRNGCEIKTFPRGTILMNELMDKLMNHIHSSDVLQDKLFEVRFVTTLSNNAVIVLIYRRPINIDDEWSKAALELSKALNVKIVGRSRKVKIVAGDKQKNSNDNKDDSKGDNDDESADDGEIIEEILTVNGNQIKYYQTEGAFSQPNAKVCEKMLKWSLDVTNNSDKDTDDLLELYCGGGTFTAALASNFRTVIATEISKASVELAHKTFKANNITNIKVARLSSEEFTEAYHNKRSFQRLKDQGINDLNKDYNITTVLVDPPRAGLDLKTCELITKFDKIVYISCNPETLARDLNIITKTHKIVRAAAFDQFPYTHHLECGIYLVKKDIDDTLLGKRKADEDIKNEAV